MTKLDTIKMKKKKYNNVEKTLATFHRINVERDKIDIANIHMYVC